MSVFCDALTGDGPYDLGECTRRPGHDGHHCDKKRRRAWDHTGRVECPNGYDHGQPPNRTERRGNKVHPRSAKDRPRYRPGTVRPY